MDKELTKLVERLERIFPDLKMYNEGKYLDKEEMNYGAPHDVDWYYIIERLKKDGLQITNSKEMKRTNCYCGNPIDTTNPDCVEFNLCKEHAQDS